MGRHHQDPQTTGEEIADTSPGQSEISWTQRIIVLQSPLWIIPVSYVMMTGALRRWTDLQYLIFSVAVALPAVVLPATLRPLRFGAGWDRAYWLKLNIWVAIVVFFGTYWGTHYFFSLMGMTYAFDVRWTFDSDLLARTTKQRVPIFMYPLTHAYFMTYFSVLAMAESTIVRQLGLRGSLRVGRLPVVFFLSYTIAWAETFFMASPLLAGFFEYADRERMLQLGSLGYSTYFVIGLPMVQRIDSDGRQWTIGMVVLESLATCMGILLLLELWAKVVGPL